MERRKLERFPLNAPARAVVESRSVKNGELDLTTKDVSSNGAFLFTSRPLPEGAVIRLDFLLALDAVRKLGGEHRRVQVKVKGKVIRVESDGFAVRFQNRYQIVATDDRQRIR